MIIQPPMTMLYIKTKALKEKKENPICLTDQKNYFLLKKIVFLMRVREFSDGTSEVLAGGLRRHHTWRMEGRREGVANEGLGE